MPDIGYASMPVIPTFKGLQGQLERGSSKGLAAAGTSGGAKFGDAAGTSAGRRFGDKFKTFAKAGVLAGLAGVAAGGKLLADSISAASHLNETVSKTGQIFGKEAIPGLEGFAEKAAGALGQSKQEALDAASTFGVFGKSAGLQGRKLVKFSTGLDSLASDLASFSDTSPEEAINAIGSALRGEAEPIRAYGVLLDEATLKAEAMRLGILKPVKDKGKILKAQVDLIEKQKAYNDVLEKNPKNSFKALDAQADLSYAQGKLQKATEGTIGPLTQQQKVLAAQSSIYRQTKDQQGDFARTSGGLANQQRQLAARFANAKAELGKGLLPVATQFVTFLNDKGVPALDKFSDWFTEKGVPAIGKFTRKATPFVKGVLTDTRDILKDIEPYAKGVASAFNSLPSGVKKGLGAAALLGFAGSKLPGVTAGAGAGADVAKSILGRFTKAGVQKVYVVNKGFGAGGGLPDGKPKATSEMGVAAKILSNPLSLLFGPGIAAGVGAFAAHKSSVGKNKAFTESEFANVAGANAGSAGGGQMASPFKPSDFIDKKLTAPDIEKKLFGTSLTTATQVAGQMREMKAALRGTKGEADALDIAMGRILAKIRASQVRLDQAVTVARQAKVDTQLARGTGDGMYVANMHVRGTSLPEVRRDADHQRRARAMGSESFR